MRFAKIPESTFQEIQLNAGVLLNSFNAETPPTEAELLEAIIGATSGGVSFSATPPSATSVTISTTAPRTPRS